MRYDQNVYVSLFYNVVHVDCPHFTKTVVFLPAVNYF